MLVPPRLVNALKYESSVSPCSLTSLLPVTDKRTLFGESGFFCAGRLSEKMPQEMPQGACFSLGAWTRKRPARSGRKREEPSPILSQPRRRARYCPSALQHDQPPEARAGQSVAPGATIDPGQKILPLGSVPLCQAWGLAALVCNVERARAAPGQKNWPGVSTGPSRDCLWGDI